jgi:hypothetical protein
LVGVHGYEQEGAVIGLWVEASIGLAQEHRDHVIRVVRDDRFRFAISVEITDRYAGPFEAF